MPKIVYTNREIIVNGIMIVACLVLAYFFPTQGLLQNLIVLAAFLIAAPLLYIKLILKKNWADFGFQVGDWKEGFWGIMTSLIFSAPLLYILINYTDLLQKQGPLKIMQGRFGDFLYYEIFFSAVIILMFEVFCRGFILFGLAKRMGHWSIGIQFLLSLVLIWVMDLFPLGISYYVIIGSVLSGIISYRSRSLIYGLAFNALFVLIADTIVIKLLK